VTDTAETPDGYRGRLRPLLGSPISDVSQPSEASMPDDVYDHPEWHAGPERTGYRATVAALRRARGRPQALITIFRAVPEGKEILPGDWVSVARPFARGHAVAHPWEHWRIVSRRVPASEVRWAGTDLMEWGWFPDLPDVVRPGLERDGRGLG
jgi:hypothetical protein